ncbi:DUF4364 family protein [Petroclostridium sp. X23]|uniref:DUF4364 family protein n=1 Tax=Petroclostridium sp. X23 TaxID=3045146 RepID=UPI0024AC964A|nr:DUF4364 family protein [Petroclostridium sp. X23]WHH60387.1 DUF4364 family protein [Petroclostridium sp. X23]
MLENNLNDITVNKLILLFILNKVNLPLTNTQITEIIMKDSIMNYFVLQQYLSELVNIGQIKAITEDDKQLYEITSEGSVTLSYFESRIPFSTKEKIQLAIVQKTKEFKRSAEVTSNYIPINQKEYMVECKIVEQNTSLIELKLTVGTKEEAKNMCLQWKIHSQKIYTDIISTLTSSNTSKKDNKTSESL